MGRYSLNMKKIEDEIDKEEKVSRILMITGLVLAAIGLPLTIIGFTCDWAIEWTIIFLFFVVLGMSCFFSRLAFKAWLRRYTKR